MEKDKIRPIQVEDETIYVKKSKLFGWGIVYPNKNQDGSINWFNLLTGGSWLKLIAIAIIVIMILLVAKEYMANLQQCQAAFNYYNLHNQVQANISLWG